MNKINPKEWATLDFSGHAWWIKNYIENFPGHGKALDFGCGTGRYTQLLKKIGYDTVGLDVDNAMIKEAKNNDGHYELIKPFSTIPFRDNYFDLAIFVWVAAHINHPDKLIDLLKEIRRVVKKGGKLIVADGSEDIYLGRWVFSDMFVKNGLKPSTNDSYISKFHKLNNLLVEDYFWEDKDLKFVFKSSSWNIIEQNNPVGKKSDPVYWNWKLELEKSPISIYLLN